MKIDSVKGVTYLKPNSNNKILMESGNVAYDHEDFWTEEEMVSDGIGCGKSK